MYAKTYKFSRQLQLVRLNFKANSLHMGTAVYELWRRAGTAQYRTEGDRNTALSEPAKGKRIHEY